MKGNLNWAELAVAMLMSVRGAPGWVAMVMPAIEGPGCRAVVVVSRLPAVVPERQEQQPGGGGRVAAAVLEVHRREIPTGSVATWKLRPAVSRVV